MPAASLQQITLSASPQPNDFDRRRIERALKARKRYRYVTPSVAPVGGGYRIESPCCSRNIDPEGGIVDVALLMFDEDRVAWRLFRKDHAKRTWELHQSYGRLIELLEDLNIDLERVFWQ
jgi:hypothetical protein